jgi:RNA polymerase sigma factor (sigma-70 family)
MTLEYPLTPLLKSARDELFESLTFQSAILDDQSNSILESGRKRILKEELAKLGPKQANAIQRNRWFLALFEEICAVEGNARRVRDAPAMKHDAWVSLFQSIRCNGLYYTFRDATLKTFLCRIISRRYAMACRTAVRKESPGHLKIVPLPVDVAATSDTSSVANDAKQRLQDAIILLPQDQIELLRCLIEYQTPNEIAKNQGVSVKTIFSKKARAIAKLRKLLNQDP